MKKEELKKLLHEYGDAVVNYRSKNSRKLKYNMCTLDFSTPCIREKRNRAKETENTLLMFCWDTYSYRLISPESVTRVDSLASILKNENI